MVTSENRSTEELLAEIALKISNIDVEFERFNEAFSADNEHVFVSAHRLRYAAFRLSGKIVVEEIVAWRISRAESSDVKPVTPFRVVESKWGYSDDPNEAEAFCP